MRTFQATNLMQAGTSSILSSLQKFSFWVRPPFALKLPFLLSPKKETKKCLLKKETTKCLLKLSPYLGDILLSPEKRKQQFRSIFCLLFRRHFYFLSIFLEDTLSFVSFFKRHFYLLFPFLGYIFVFCFLFKE